MVLFAWGGYTLSTYEGYRGRGRDRQSRYVSRILSQDGLFYLAADALFPSFRGIFGVLCGVRLNLDHSAPLFSANVLSGSSVLPT